MEVEKRDHVVLSTDWILRVIVAVSVFSHSCHYMVS